MSRTLPALDDTFLVISGDCATDFDLAEAAAITGKQALATIVLTRVLHPWSMVLSLPALMGGWKAVLGKPRLG